MNEDEKLINATQDHGDLSLTKREKTVPSIDIRLSNYNKDQQEEKPDIKNEASPKTNKLKWILIGGSVIIILTLVIVLSITLPNKYHPFRPSAPPPPPIIPDPTNLFVNNYAVSEESQQDGVTYKGFIISNQYNSDLHSKILNKLFSQDTVSDPHNLYLNGRVIPEGINNRYINNASFLFGMSSYKVAYLTISDAKDQNRFSIPSQFLNNPQDNPMMRLEMLGLQVESNPFSFSFTDVTDKSNVFIQTKSQTLILMDKYLQIDFQLPSQKMFGFGERKREFMLGEGVWTMWTKGSQNEYDDGTSGGKQGFGVHPFIMIQSKQKGDFFGMFFRNSNAQSPVIKFNDDGTSTLSYITTGGQLEIYFFIHGNVKSMIKEYHILIGLPYLPPFWAMGWQQASQNYQTQTDIEKVVLDYKNSDLPLESIYVYSNSYSKSDSNFEVDLTKFSSLSDDLHQFNQYLVVQANSGLQAQNVNDQYLRMSLANGALIQSTINQGNELGNSLVSERNSIKTVFLDFLNSYGIETVWYYGLLHLFDQIKYDGLFFEDNEITADCNGECPQYIQIQKQDENKQKTRNLEANDKSWYYSFKNQNKMSTYYLPFIPGYFYQGNLDSSTLSLNSTHQFGETEYNLHSLFGLMMSKQTFSFLTNKNEFYNSDLRPFILSRSTFSGSGNVSSHVVTNNQRLWDDMRLSISQMMNMNLFGVTHTGSDICGYYGDSQNDELCARWIQLATFYPLTRFNYDLNSIRSEPYLVSETWKPTVRQSMKDRYQYLRHLYTCLFESGKFGGSCIDPLFYFYPKDSNLYINIEQSFMVGGCIKVSPILSEGITQFTSYFPMNSGFWVNLANYQEIIDSSQEGKYATLQSLQTVNAHLKPGSIIPFQDQKNYKLLQTTSQLIYGPMSLIINRDSNGMAKGSLLLDGGKLRSEIDNSKYEYYQLVYSSNSINKFFEYGTMNSQPKYTLDKIIILNAHESRAGGDLSMTDFACYLDYQFQPTQLKFVFNPQQFTLTLSQIDNTMIPFNVFKTIHFGYSKTDINLCNPDMYKYKLSTAILPDLSTYKTQFTITNMINSVVLPDLQVSLQMMASNIVNVRWTFLQKPNGQRQPFEVPKQIVSPIFNGKAYSLSNTVSISDQPFVLSIKSLTGTKVIDFNGIIYHSWLNIIKTTLTSNPDLQYFGVFGLGEHASFDLQFKDGVYSLWNTDHMNPLETGNPPGNNLYGTHPFYMAMNDISSWIGVYTNIANAQDWYIKNDIVNKQTYLTTIATGGVADIYVIIGHDPKQIVSDYWNYIIGRPLLPPVYALGWNQCRWGYKNTQAIQNVVDNYKTYNIPLDVQWVDIDAMSNYRDFTLDTYRYSDLPTLVQNLHKQNIKFVPIVDAGIAMRPWGNYNVYDQGIQQNVFMKANSENTNVNYMGSVWPNQVAFADWFSPNVQQWWQSNLETYHKLIDFDGLWLDMNEISNFCSGICDDRQMSSKTVLQYLKYVPTNRDLNDDSMSIDAVHSNGVIQFDSHSLFGSYEVMNSYQYFVNNNKRPFIISRSSFSGMGKYGSRWLGDNWSSIEYLEVSITGIMLMNIFGIPLTGSDICGYANDTTPELCARWTVAGSFFPFSRNHNEFTASDQEPYVQQFQQIYEDQMTYTDIMRQAIRNKYHLIKYYYTHMFLQSMYGTGSFFNPLFFSFPEDLQAFQDVHLNIMLGSALKLSVQTGQLGQNYTQFYFPKGTYCNIFVHDEPCITLTQGTHLTLQTKAYDFYVHLLVGYIIPMQDATFLNINTTTDLQKYPVDFHILGQPNNKFYYSWYAQGIYINDNGLDTDLTGNFNQYSIIAKAELSDPNLITIVFDQVYTATNHLEIVSNCNAVNKNDYLGSIFIYNAQALKATGKYMVMATMNDGQKSLVGQAQYQGKIDKLVLRATASIICLPNVKYLTYTLLE